MTNKNLTKRALLTSVIAMLVCFTMLLGTTFAWFTDEVSSEGNIIQAGNLDVNMEWAMGTSDPAAATWNEASQKIFENDNWEPGYVEARHIKISNEGSLAFKYQVLIEVEGEVGSLADVIDVYYLDPAQAIGTRAELTELTPLGTLTEVLANLASTGSGELLAGEKVTITLALKMQETAGNEYQNAKIGDSFTVKVLATQLTYEEDDFGDDYDEDAYLPVVNTAAELVAAIKDGVSVTLGSDIALDETVVVPEGETVEIDLNEKTLTGNTHKNVGAVIKNEGTLTLVNGTVTSSANNGGSALLNNGTATVENVTLNGAPNADGSWPSYAVNNEGVLNLNDCDITSYHGSVSSYNAGAVVYMNNTDIEMTGILGFTNHGIYTFNNGKVVVNGGNIANNAPDQNGTGGSVINGNVEIISGNFKGRIEAYSGTPVIKAGTFTANPTNYVSGSEVIDNGDGTWTVKPYAVSTADALTTAFNEGKNVQLTADMETTGLVVPSGKDILLDLNGHTISCLDSTNSSSALLTNKGSLEITGKGSISYVASNPDTDWNPEGFPTYANNTIRNEGNLVISGDVVIENQTSGGAAYAIDNYAGSSLTINGGVIKHTNGNLAIRIFTASATATNVTINGGQIEGRRAIWVQLAGGNSAVAPEVNVTINGGVLSGTQYVIYGYSYGNSYANVDLTINGGEFNGSSVVVDAGYFGDTSTVTINGGLFEYSVYRRTATGDVEIYPANK